MRAKVVILCGGQGTRMREETEFRPKPLVDVGKRPILWHIMKLYAHHGFNEFVLCLGYKGEMIKDYFLNYEAMTSDFTVSLGQTSSIRHHGGRKEQDMTVTVADTGQDTLTGGRVKRIQRYVDTDIFMVTYGDGLSDLNITDLINYHRSHGRLATLTSVRPSSRFGELTVGELGNVMRFSEKPQLDSWASAGFFVFDKRVFDYLCDDVTCTLEREPLEQLAKEGQLMAYRHDGFFFAMDTYREYLYLNQLWESGAAPWKVW